MVGQQHNQQQQVGYGDPMRRLTQSGGIGMGNTSSSRSITTPSPEKNDYYNYSTIAQLTYSRKMKEYRQNEELETACMNEDKER